MDAPKDATIRKRQQISDSSKRMFLWVAGASVVVGFALVGSWFLVQQIVFKEKVIGEKSKTVSTLQSNNKVASDLTSNVRVLETNDQLNSVKVNPQEKALQVILDALPADNNKLALGASIQSKLVSSVPNVRLESFSVGQDSVSVSVPAAANGVQTIPFVIVVSSADPNAVKDVLKKFESSIRTIQVDSIKLEQSDVRMTMTLNGHAFYMPPVVIQLSDKVVKP